MIWLASHGFLHLLGWEHNNEHDLENIYKTSSNVLKSFKYAFSGISYVLKTSRNFKIQLIFAVTSLKLV